MMRQRTAACRVPDALEWPNSTMCRLHHRRGGPGGRPGPWSVNLIISFQRTLNTNGMYMDHCGQANFLINMNKAYYSIAGKELDYLKYW